MGIEYKIWISPMNEERFVQHIHGLPHMRTFDDKRKSYALFSAKSEGTPFAYVMLDEGARRDDLGMLRIGTRASTVKAVA